MFSVTVSAGTAVAADRCTLLNAILCYCHQTEFISPTHGRFLDCERRLVCFLLIQQQTIFLAETRHFVPSPDPQLFVTARITPFNYVRIGDWCEAYRLHIDFGKIETFNYWGWFSLWSFFENVSFHLPRLCSTVRENNVFGKPLTDVRTPYKCTCDNIMWRKNYSSLCEHERRRAQVWRENKVCNEMIEVHTR